MIQNVYVQNLVASLILVIVLYALNRSDEQKPGWKSYLRTFVLTFVVLSGVDFVRPILSKGSASSLMTGGSVLNQPVSTNLVPVSTEAISKVDIGPSPF